MAEIRNQGRRQPGAKKPNPVGAKKTTREKTNVRTESIPAHTEKTDVTVKTAQVDPSSAFHQLMIVLLAVLALFVTVCFIFKNNVGVLGRWIADGCFGLFGFGAVMIPILLCQLALFWKRDIVSGAARYKYIIAILTVFAVSVIAHTIWSMAQHQADLTISQALAWDRIKGFFADGMAHKGGGLTGGYFASLLICSFGYPGALIFGFLFLIVLLLSLFGLTFSECIRRYRFYRQLAKNDRRVKTETKKQQREEKERFQEPRSSQTAKTVREEPSAVKEKTAHSSEKREQPPKKQEYSHKKQETPTKKHASIDSGIFAENAEFGKAEKTVSAEVREIKNDQRRSQTELPEPDFIQRKSPEREKADDDVFLARYIGYEDALIEHNFGDTERPARSKAIGERSGLPTSESADENIFQLPVHKDPAEVTPPRKQLSVPKIAPVPKKESAVTPKKESVTVPKKESVPVIIKETPTICEEPVQNDIAILPPDPSPELPVSPNGEEDDFVPVRPAYEFPPMALLDEGERSYFDENVSAELRENADKIIQTLESFHVRVTISHVSRGPTVTRYELEPAAGTRVRSILNLLDDIALSLATNGVRSDGIITGKSAIGIEVPNKVTSLVYVRELIGDKRFMDAKSRLTTCLGMDVSGAPVYLDIAKMPHLLIAGATGMGKSVCINSLLVSLLYKARPDEVKLILIDPKKVELNIYNGIPHLLVPVVFDAKKAAGSLHWAVTEMERRFELIEAQNTRNISQYNAAIAGDPQKEFLPQIVIVIDELADLMMSAPDDVESSICRLAQKARAAGMHLIIGTQRPSVDVITGLIKANIPSRIAFTVASQVDSRTIIDSQGAEKLIGKGDMLYAPVGASKPIRVQGAFVSEGEIEDVVRFIKEHSSAAYSKEVMAQINHAAETAGQKKGKGSSSSDTDADDRDPMLESAIELALESGKISTSLIQRRLSLGYGRAAKLIDILERRGFVSPPEGQKPRTVLITREQYLEMQMRQADHQTDGF